MNEKLLDSRNSFAFIGDVNTHANHDGTYDMFI